MNKNFSLKLGKKLITIDLTVAQQPEVTDDDQTYVMLNNLYLAIERGDKTVTVSTKNDLCWAVGKLWPIGDCMREYWEVELQKLPGWDKI